MHLTDGHVFVVPWSEINAQELFVVTRLKATPWIAFENIDL